MRIYDQDIWMKFGNEKWAMTMKKEKRETMDRKELPSQESIRTLGEKENYKYFEILNTIKQRSKKK